MIKELFAVVGIISSMTFNINRDTTIDIDISDYSYYFYLESAGNINDDLEYDLDDNEFLVFTQKHGYNAVFTCPNVYIMTDSYNESFEMELYDPIRWLGFNYGPYEYEYALVLSKNSTDFPYEMELHTQSDYEYFYSLLENFYPLVNTFDYYSTDEVDILLDDYNNLQIHYNDLQDDYNELQTQLEDITTKYNNIIGLIDENSSYTLPQLLDTYAKIPFDFMNKLLDFNVFGVSLIGAVCSILLVAVIVWLIKVFK